MKLLDELMTVTGLGITQVSARTAGVSSRLVITIFQEHAVVLILDSGDFC